MNQVHYLMLSTRRYTRIVNYSVYNCKLAVMSMILQDALSKPRWRHSYRTKCTYDRSQFHEKRVYFESMFANTNVRDFFLKGLFWRRCTRYLGKKGIFLWFARMWNPKNHFIPCLIYSRITQVLVIVEWFLQAWPCIHI